VEQLIKFEIKKELIYMNGDNNKSILKKRKIKSDHAKWMNSYCSTGWVIIRGAWLFDYLYAVFHKIQHNRDMKFGDIATTAYDEALAKHHPWIL